MDTCPCGSWKVPTLISSVDTRRRYAMFILFFSFISAFTSMIAWVNMGTESMKNQTKVNQAYTTASKSQYFIVFVVFLKFRSSLG